MKFLTPKAVSEIAQSFFGITVNDAIKKTVISGIMCDYQDYIRRLHGGAIDTENTRFPDKLIARYISNAVKSIDRNYIFENKQFCFEG